MGVDCVRLYFIIEPVDCGLQRFTQHDSSRPIDKCLEHGELTTRDEYSLSIYAKRAARSVEFQIADHDYASLVLSQAPYDGFAASEKFDRFEGLAKVVVCAGVECLCDFIGIVESREHQDPRLRTETAQIRKQLDPITVRQSAIDHDQVERLCKGRTNFRPPWRSKTRPRTADSLNDEGARSGLFIVCRGS